MSRSTMTAAAALLPRAPIYGIGTYRTSAGVHDFEIGWGEFDRDTDWATEILDRSGIGARDIVVVTSPNWENPWTSPVIRALRRLGATYAPVEQFSWDARRLQMFLQRLPVRAVIGLGAETLTAMAAGSVSVADQLDGVDVIWARNDAVGLLDSVGADVVPFVPIGPALALGVPGRPDALINGREWQIDSAAGSLTVTNRLPRSTTFVAAPSDVQGVAVREDDSTIAVALRS